MVLIIVHSLEKFYNQDVQNVLLYVSLDSNLKRHKEMVHEKRKKHFCNICVYEDPESPGSHQPYGCYTKQDMKRHYATQDHQRRMEMVRYNEMQDHQRRMQIIQSQVQMAYPVAQPFYSGINGFVSNNVQGLSYYNSQPPPPPNYYF